jgi:hypothetical protein
VQLRHLVVDMEISLCYKTLLESYNAYNIGALSGMAKPIMQWWLNIDIKYKSKAILFRVGILKLITTDLKKTVYKIELKQNIPPTIRDKQFFEILKLAVETV